MVLSWEQRLALEHFSKDAACTPDVDLDIVFLPCKHDLRGAVVAGGNVTGHLRVLYTGQAEIADLQITVLVHEDVAGLQVAVDDTSGVNIFQSTLSTLVGHSACCIFATYQNLVKEVLDELLLQRPGGEQTVEIGSEELGDEVTEKSANISTRNACASYISSKGEMKISLKLIIWYVVRARSTCTAKYDPYVLVPQVLKQLQLAVCALREDRSAERLHDLLDRHGLAGELVLRRAAFSVSI
jgi:hypothetical protein